MGADHGLFSLYLSSIGHKVIAVENKIGPFTTLKKACEKDKNIKCLLSDGIEILPQEVDCCCILGMGGLTIYEILSKDISKLNQLETIIISPQSLPNKPIEFLLDHGYINDEGFYIYEKKYYPILRFVKGDDKSTAIERKYGPAPVKKNDKLLFEMLQKEKNQLMKYSSFEDSITRLNLLEKEIEEIYL